MSFDQLPAPLQNALTVRPYIRVTTLLKQSDSDLKYEVFLRLNTGGDRLTAQEIRNVAFSGPLNDLLFELSEHDFLKDRLKIDGPKSSAYRSMEDLEHVLRFFTVRDVWTNMRHPLGEEMDLFMERNRTANTAEMRNLFLAAITACEKLWGQHAFHKPTQGGWRTQLISPLYDAQMVAASMMIPIQLDFEHQSHDRVISATRALFENDPLFVKSVTQSTNNALSVRKRVIAIKDLLESALGR